MKPKRHKAPGSATRSSHRRDTPPHSRALRRAVALAMLIGVCFAAYQPVWHGDLLWDDPAHVTRPELQSAEGLRRIWFDVGATQQYYPITHSAFWFFHRMWGDATTGYHLANIALHACSAFLIALLVGRLRLPGAWLAATIFALHPVHVESVAWITELKNVLSGVLCLAAALAYLSFDSSRRRATYALAVVLFVLAVLSKSATAVLPAALLVIMWWWRGYLSWRQDVVPLLPMFALGIAAGLTTAWIEYHAIGARGKFMLTALERVLVAGRAVWFYLGKLAWPADLMFVYPRWHISLRSWLQYVFPLSLAIAAAVFWAWRHRSRAPLAALLLFCGVLFPALGFFNVYPFRFSYVADHFQYLASIPAIVFAASAATLLTSPLGVRFAAALTLVTSVVLGTLTWRHAHTFQNDVTLFRTAAARNPESWLAHNNLASRLIAGPYRDISAARVHAETAVRLNSRYPQARYNLARALEQSGDPRRAEHEYREALSLEPRYVEAYERLGILLMEQRRPAEAFEHLRAASDLNPDNAHTHRLLGDILLGWGRIDEAVDRYSRSLTIAATPDAHNALGVAYTRRGDYRVALASYAAALQIRPTFVDAYVNQALTFIRMGRVDEAIAAFQEALRLQPRDADVHHDVGVLLEGQGRRTEALRHMQIAVELNPHHERARQAIDRLRGR